MSVKTFQSLLNNEIQGQIFDFAKREAEQNQQSSNIDNPDSFIDASNETESNFQAILNGKLKSNNSQES